jgi:drug/metabolite transporter (DMT)-like permease
MGAQYLDPSHIAVIASLEPVVTIILGIIVLGETFSVKIIIGAGMIVLGIVFITIKKK